MFQLFLTLLLCPTYVYMDGVQGNSNSQLIVLLFNMLFSYCMLYGLLPAIMVFNYV